MEAFFVVVTACVLLGLAVGALVAARRVPGLTQTDGTQLPSSQSTASRTPASPRRPGDD